MVFCLFFLNLDCFIVLILVGLLIQSILCCGVMVEFLNWWIVFIVIVYLLYLNVCFFFSIWVCIVFYFLSVQYFLLILLYVFQVLFFFRLSFVNLVLYLFIIFVRWVWVCCVFVILFVVIFVVMFFGKDLLCFLGWFVCF